MPETAEQQQERVRRHLIEAMQHIEADLAATNDTTMRRIEADAATVVALSVVNELLPEPIQEQVQAIIDLHEEVWTTDSPAASGTTPRKPLGERLLHKFSVFTRMAQKHLVRIRSF